MIVVIILILSYFSKCLTYNTQHAQDAITFSIENIFKRQKWCPYSIFRFNCIINFVLLLKFKNFIFNPSKELTNDISLFLKLIYSYIDTWAFNLIYSFLCKISYKRYWLWPRFFKCILCLFYIFPTQNDILISAESITNIN